MKVYFKKNHAYAKTPTYAMEGDACMDLFSVTSEVDTHGNIVYDTGISIEIPSGFVGLVFQRSSVSKTSLSLRNAVGVIDSGYRGNIKLKFCELNETANSLPNYSPGDRVGQLMIIERPQIELVETDQLSETDRDQGGFGSTGS